MKAWLPMALVLLAQWASAMDRSDARGLSVTFEPIAEPMIVDGIAMHVERAHGPQVSELARRIEARWRQERSHVLHGAHGDWHMRSRWAGLRSEVMQWRGEGDRAELLLSWFDASRRPVAAPAAGPIALPSQCAWARRVEGRSLAGRYEQLTARCRISVAGLAARLDPLLERHAWTVLHKGDLGWDMTRAREAARAIVVAGDTGGESALVWITTVRGDQP